MIQVLFLILLVISCGCKIWQFFLCFTKLIVVFLFVRVNTFDLIMISTTNIDLCPMAAHVVRVLAKL